MSLIRNWYELRVKKSESPTPKDDLYYSCEKTNTTPDGQLVTITQFPSRAFLSDEEKIQIMNRELKNPSFPK